MTKRNDFNSQKRNGEKERDGILGIMISPPFFDDAFFNEDEKKTRENMSADDEDTSHLSDERHKRFAPSPVIQNWKKKRSGSFVR